MQSCKSLICLQCLPGLYLTNSRLLLEHISLTKSKINQQSFKTNACTHTQICSTYPISPRGVNKPWGLCENLKQNLTRAQYAWKEWSFNIVEALNHSGNTSTQLTFEEILWNAAGQTPSWRTFHLAPLFPDWFHFCCQRTHPVRKVQHKPLTTNRAKDIGLYHSS